MGEVTSRAEARARLTDGPLHVGFTAALGILGVAAGLLLTVGVALLLAAQLQARSVELARLRALGLPRRGVLGLLLTQHGLVLTLLVLLGAGLGGVAAVALGPPLIASSVDGGPALPVVLRWPWPTETATTLGLVAACVAVTAVVAVLQVRRGDASELRVGDE